jgi:pilus assembly protein Flp/PilA
MLKDQKGATAIEYGLIAALIAVAAITAMQGWAPSSTRPSRASQAT